MRYFVYKVITQDGSELEIKCQSFELSSNDSLIFRNARGRISTIIPAHAYKHFSFSHTEED